MGKKEKILKLGLDIGTNSVGWALLDENNKIVKKNGHAFWGVRMFEEGKPAVDRGTFRRNRRRLARRKERTNIIKSLFKNEILKVDEKFYERLNDSFYHQEDKRNNNVSNIFNDTYTDKDFYNEYPTIFHLRNAMLTEDKKFDIRMLYLAVSHIVKYRGNFLYAGEEFSFNDSTIISEFFTDFNDALLCLKESFTEEENYSDKYFDQVELSNSFYDNLKDILINTSGITNRKVKLLQLFNVDKKSIYNELVIPLLAGTKVNVSNLTIVKFNKYEKSEIQFNDSLPTSLDNAINTISELSEILELIPSLKDVSDFYFVNKVLGDNTSLSAAMVNIYNKHKNDLYTLKQIIKKYLPSKYNEVFRTKNDKLNNYVHYVGFNSIKGKIERFSHCSKEDFYAYLKKILTPIEDKDTKIKDVLQDIDNGDFLSRQNSNQNGAFPMQLHLKELQVILSNQSKYYPFLNEVSDGITTIDKIILTFKYKLPYYVGPLNRKSSNSWVVRKDDKIYPWNIDNVIDHDNTAEKFIRRMQNKCTYLKGDDDYCLAKNSILFSEYNCLSYLNKITINGQLLNKELKMQIFNEVFLSKKQPTKKDILDCINRNYGTSALTTKQKELPEVTCNMSSLIKLKEILGTDFNCELAENIINDITIFEDKGILERRLSSIYNLSKDKISKLKGLNYKEYSRLCKKLLDGIIICDKSTGEVIGTIIEIMRNTNLNLQEILYYQDYNTLEVIDEENSKYPIDDTNYTVDDYINDNLIISPAFKRSLIQSYTIIKEIERIFNRPIDEFYVECTRTNKDKKTPSKSRYDRIKELYASCKDIANEYNIDLNRLKNELESKKDSLKVDKLYLYFTQLGKCMYSLEDINIEELNNNYKYDIDHIYPQSIIKDDSMTNRVLVNKTKNASKTNTFLFDSSVLDPNAPKFFNKLSDLDLISKEKYRRLTQKELSPEELNGFVNRQLVSTNQAVKGLISLLKNYHNVDEKNIIFSKGENVSDFRKKFELVKSRTANNFHHAHDAYLNVIVGGILNKYYNSRSFIKFGDLKRIQTEKESVNPDTLFERNTITAFGKVIWNKDEDIAKIKKDLYNRFDITETFRTYNPNEMLSKVTILPAGHGSVPIQTSTARADINKYGAIESFKFSKYVIIKKTTKKGIDTILEAIPRMYCDTKESIDKYINELYSNDKRSISVEIVNYNIKVNSVIEIENRRFVITGKSNNSLLLKNIKDRFFSMKSLRTIKKIDKYFNNKKFNYIMPIINDEIIISPAKNNKCKEILLSLKDIKELLNEIYYLFTKDIYNYSVIIEISKVVKQVIDKTNNEFDYNLESYIYLCNSLLKLLKTNDRSSADLTNIGFSSNSGILTCSKTLKPGTKFIWNSITGYYKKVIYEVN